jgi:regulator of sigma E protease
MAGMEAYDPDPRGFNRKTVGQRLAVISAGSLMNFLLAILLFTGILLVIGVPSQENVIGNVLPGKPAALAGLQSGDRITAINGREVTTWSDIVSIIHQSPGQQVELTLDREGQRHTLQLVPQKDPGEQVGLIGIEQEFVKQGLLTSLAAGFSQAVFISLLILKSLWQVISGQAPAEIAGPVGIVQMVGEVARFGPYFIINFTALLSLNLGLLNLFPIPALDGSRIIFLIMEKLRGRPVDPQKENMVHLVGFVLLILLMVLITYHDVVKMFA